MQREILFRGKCVDNDEWVYGDLIQRQYCAKIGCYEITPPTWNDPCGDSIYVEYEVKRETVGQYTGLKDKQGVMIFEPIIGNIHDQVKTADKDSVTNTMNTNFDPKEQQEESATETTEQAAGETVSEETEGTGALAE